MNAKLTLVASLIAASSMFSAHAMTKAEYDAAKDRIEQTHKADKKACDAMKDNAKDVCEKEADGKEKIAKAELEQSYKPSDRNARKVQEVRADTTYDIAKEKCDDMNGDAKKSCENDAKAARDTAKRNLKG
ncbi:MAG: hypothetical protein J0H69_10065 [Burkholderiales bacterium]|nr:hypothetical protein [Burkholderiales bacterium]